MREVNPAAVLENDKLRISFDDKGRIIALRSKVTGTEFLTYPGLEENWRIMVLTGGHPVYYIWGKDQTPAEVSRTATGVTFHYRGLAGKEQHYAIDVDFTASLVDDEARFDLKIVNGHDQRIREAWYPILGGFQGFEEAGQAQMVHLAKSRTLARDILHRGLPGHEYLFVVEGETAQYYYPGEQMQWIDLYSQEQGLYVSCDDKSLTTTVFRLEKYPPEHGSTGAPWVSELALFPEDTPRWMRIMVGKLTAIDPGETWQSPPAVIWPHAGDWHTAAKHYRAWADTWMKWPQRAAWLKDYVGWQHIVGKTYLNEVYHTFDDYIRVMEEAQQKSGVDTLMVYGHTEIGCEGSDYTMTPAANLGGPEGSGACATHCTRVA
ncbi:MAG: hypothetical protein M5R40_20235 [Anaerolineae bacterium]|nr:hypothetical protein [Anaerolineae bacterium]